MDRSYWNEMATRYDEEIFSVIESDRKQKVCSHIRRFASRNKVATDLGCGVGKFLGVLSQSFRQVFAVDFSAVCLGRAQANCRDLPNVTYHRADLSQGEVPLPNVDFVLCVNTLITPSLRSRRGIWQSTGRHLHPGGRLVLVVPALESGLLANYRLIDWNLEQGLSPAAAVRRGFVRDRKVDRQQLRQGILEIDRVPTKHFLKEELQLELAQNGFTVDTIQKVEYSWDTEFCNPPPWMQAPYPWDWVAVARKRRSSKRPAR